MKTLPAVFALLLAVAPVVSAAALLPAGSAGPVADVPGTRAASGGIGLDGRSPDSDADTLGNRSMNVLSLRPGSINASAVETQYVDMGSGLSFDRSVAAMRLRTLTMVERVRSAPAGEQRQRRILGELNDIEQRVVTLRSDQQKAFSAYSTGSISTRQFLLRLAAIDAQARELEHRRTRLREIAQETEGLGLSAQRFTSLERELDTFTGPVRQRVGNVVTGQNQTVRVFVATSSDSVVLSTLAGGQYVREAYRGDLRSLDGGSALSPEEALNITAEQYPVVWDLRANSTAVVGAGTVYRVTVPHKYGRLTTLVNTGTKQVFMESQTRSLASFPPTNSVTRTRDNLRMTVNRSYPGGPVRISLVDARTGDPVSANVTIGPASGGNSDFVGYTGSDGVLWALSPVQEYTVFAIKGNSVVAINANPVSPPRVYPANDSSGGSTNATATPAPAGSGAPSGAN